MNYDKVGSFIKEKRKEKNLTQKELAEKINVTDKAISKWERGQGCPDVSILEVLSKELGCSILELLKGREIENEVIPVTEVDDYIRDGLLLSENRVKDVFLKITEFAIIFMVTLLCYLNIVQVLYIDKEREFDLSGTRRGYLEADEMVKNNIELINSNQGTFMFDDYENIKSQLDLIYQNIKDTKIHQYIMNDSIVKYKVHDILLIGANPYIHDKASNVIKILRKYDENNSFIEFGENLSFSNVLYYGNNEPFLTYEYRLTISNIDFGATMYEDDEDWAHSSAFYNRRLLVELYYLTEVIKKVGGIYE